MKYILIATDRSTRQTMYWSGADVMWHYGRGFARTFKSKAAAVRQADHLNETDHSVFDVAVVVQ